MAKIQTHTKILIASCILLVFGFTSWSYSSTIGNHIPFDRTVYHSIDTLPNTLAILRYVLDPTDIFEHITIESYADPSINYVHQRFILGIYTDSSTTALTTFFDNDVRWMDCSAALLKLKDIGLSFNCSGNPDMQVRVTQVARPLVVDALVKRMKEDKVYALLIAPNLVTLTVANIGQAIVLAVTGLTCMVISAFLCFLFYLVRSAAPTRPKKRVTFIDDHRTC